MPRTRTQAIVIFSFIAFITSCTAPEEQLVDTFLTAVRDGHEEMIRGVSVVNLPDADVQSWEIVEVSPETIEPYRLAELRATFFDATKTWEDNIEENDKFLNDNEENTLRYRDRIKADPDYKFTSGAMAEYQEEWERRVEEVRELASVVRATDEALKRERDNTYMSANMVARETFEGDIEIKTVRVNVNGDSGSRTYELTLRKYNVVDSETGIKPISRWIVAEIDG